MVTENTEEQQAPHPEGPGRRLREAREARRLTREQVASQLRLQLRLIIALEEDDYSAIPGTTFVQGYLRSYARLLGLPEASILALAHTDGVASPQLVPNIANMAEASSRDTPMRFTSFIIVALVVAVIGWWLSQRELPPPEPVAEIVQEGGELALPLPPIPVDEGTSDAETVVTEGEVTPVEETAPEPEPMPTESPATPQVVSAAIGTPVAAPPLTDDMPQSRLELRFEEECWTEVTDAAGRPLVYGLVPAGQRLELRGEAPFRIFLGYAAGVSVHYNGALYDHTPYQRKEMARFRLGKAEHNHPLTGN